METRQFGFKIVVLGDVGVGKTAFEEYVIHSHPNSTSHYFQSAGKSYRQTIRASFCVLDLDVEGIKVKLEFWIIADGRGFVYQFPSFINYARAAILLYDITNATSIDRLTEWLSLITEQYDELPMVLAGNKVDMEENRAISREVGLAFQREHNLTSFMEISLKTGEGVDKMFEFLRDLLLEKLSEFLD